MISPADYLETELLSPIKREYIAGRVYAMGEFQNRHNIIAGNTLVTLHARLRGKKCRPFNSDTKLRIRFPNHVRFYYPDVQVVCQPNSVDESFQDQPNVIVEVLSESTRRTDEGEKLDAYLTIPSLETYLLVDSTNKEVVVQQRGDTGFTRSVYIGDDGVIPLACLGFDLPLAEIYEGVQLPALEVVEAE
ncbi:MAG: Uma2 family endonuclease [Prosthecobacter sp.]|uniref:Uma2 family endonuclease n=1 Tax=Prosthecobacter sp. TaxID=1965333 RepID=UPI003904469F